jgi:rhodanese-related sulfurtransferase
MSRKTTRSHRRSSSNRLSAFFKRPLVQLGIVAIAVLAIVAIILLNNNQKPAQTASLPAEITAEQAYQKYQQDVFFLDVREPDEWNSGHIPNTTLIPLGELQARLNELPRDKEIVVVCRSGNRSQQGRDILLQNGFTNVTSMAGGVRAWGTAGYPFEGAIP